MKKTIFLYISLIMIVMAAQASQSQQSFFASMVDEYDKPFEQCLKEHREAFDMVEKNKSRVVVYTWTSRTQNQITVHYEYRCSDAEMIEIVNNYTAAKQALEHKLYGRALGNGFAIGTLIALYNKLMNNRDIKATTELGLSFLPALFIVIQNSTKEKIPFFDIGLQKQENKYATLSWETFGSAIGRMVCATGSSAISFLGTSFALNIFLQK